MEKRMEGEQSIVVEFETIFLSLVIPVHCIRCFAIRLSNLKIDLDS